MIRQWATAALLLLSAVARAQYPHPSFRQYTIDNGLPSSDVYMVQQDSQGYIWFATGNGVSRYNGYEFENFSMSNGLPDNTVFEIFEDPVHRIWFLPISGKLSYYYKGKIHLYQYNDSIERYMGKALKMSFSVEADGTVHMGMYRKGIYHISPQGRVTHDAYTDEHAIPLVITQPASGPFIYCLGKGLPGMSAYKMEFHTRLVNGVLTIPTDVLTAQASTRVIVTKKKHILIGLDTALYDIESATKFSHITLRHRIQWLYEDADSDLWIGTYSGGLYYLPKGDFSKKRHYLTGYAITGVVQDREGGFWCSTEGNGVFYTPSKHILIYDHQSGIMNEKINSIACAGDKIYVGTQDGFLYMVKDSITGRINTNSQGQLSNDIAALYYNPHNKELLVGSKLRAGVLLNGHYLSSKVYNTYNEALICRDDSNTYWLGCANLLGKVRGDTITSPWYMYAIHHRINALIYSSDHTLLLGEVDGLWEFDTNSKIHRWLGGKNRLLQNRVLSLAYTSDSLLLIATKGAGILVKNGDVVQQIDKLHGLAGDNVYKLFPLKDGAWVATDNGLSRLTILRKEPLRYEIRNYRTSEGLPSNEVNDVLEKDNTVWAATNKGLIMFVSSTGSTWNSKLPLYVTKVMIGDSTYPLRKRYDLSHAQNNIRIAFTALGYRNAGKLQYRYKLEGLDTSWTYTQNREVQYTTLPPEHYRFLLAVLNNGRWDRDQVQVAFVVNRAFWQQWWFRVMVVLLVLAALFFAFRYRVNVIKREEAKNSELHRSFLNLKLKALRAQMNPHFTFNVMNSIQHFILNNDNESANRYLSKFSRLIRNILNNSESNSIMVEEEIITLQLYLELEVMRFDNKFSYTITLDPAINPAQAEIPSMLIQPYVENAIKHGVMPLKEHGRIGIEITKEDRFLKCVITDNGVGRAKAAENHRARHHRGMGTSLTRERLSVINELGNSQLSEKIIDLYDKDNNPAGTRVEIYIPLH